MALKSQAEVSLLLALNQKKARSASVFLKEQQQRASDGQTTYEVERDGGREAGARADTTKARPATEQDLMVAQVRQLEHHVVASRRHESDELSAVCPSDPAQDEHNQIKQNALRRRDAHMCELMRYEGAVKDISERIEATLIATFDRVKESLADIDARVALIENQELQDRAHLLEATKGEIAGAWDRLEALTKQRTALIAQFAAELERVEESRVADVRAQLEQLTFALMAIAYALGPEVERIVEGEAYQVNVVVIANRKVYADLVARLATTNVDVFVHARLSWERALDRWRALRHAHALEVFKQTLGSPAFRDPEDRRRIMEAIRAHQQVVHDEKRLAALRELREESAALTSERVQQVVRRLQVAQQQEEDANDGFFLELRGAHERRVQDALELQEALRLELHGFGALAREGEVEEAKRALEHMLAVDGAALEDFFRMAGGLRGDLESITKRLDVAELIYERNVEPLMASVRVLLSALPLESVMETQGKGAERRALQTTLDKIRKASKADMPALVSLLQAQMQILHGLEGLNETFKEEVDALAAQLSVVSPPEAAEGGVASSNSTLPTAAAPDAAPTSSPALNRTATMKQGSTGVFVPGTTPPGVSSSPTGVKRATVAIATDPGSQVDLQAIRRIQRRLAALVFASQLPESMQQHLQFICDQLALQSAANRVVDAVIHRECDELLASQQRAGLLFLEEIGRRMEQQSALLHSQCEKVAKFHLSVVSAVEKSNARAKYVDLSVLDLLDTLKEHNDDAIGDMEARYAQSCAGVRHAPDPRELHGAFHRCTELLAGMEGEYRAYEARVRVASEHNVIAADAQRSMFLQQLTALLGLVVPTSLDARSLREQSELDEFLSAKHIEEVVDPPAAPLVPADDEAADKAEDAESAAMSDTEAPPEHAPSTPRRPDELQQDIETLEVYSLPSGAELRCRWNIQALVGQILSVADEDEDSGAVDVKSAPSDAPEAADGHATSPSAMQQAVGDGESSAENQASDPAENQQESEISGQLARDWLPLEIPLSYLEPLVESFRDAVLAKYDAEGVAASAVLLQTREVRFETAGALLEERLRMHWPRRGRLDVQLFQPRLGELESHRQRTDRHVRTLLSRVESQQRVFERKAEEILGEIASERDAQVAFQAQLPLQTSLAALQGLEARAKKGLATLKSAGHDKITVVSSSIDSDMAALATSNSEFVRTCSSQVFPDLSGCEVISGCDYHPEEVAQVQRALEDVEQQARAQISLRSARVDAIRADLECVLGMWPAFKTRCHACIQTLSMKEGLGQKFGLPRRAAQEKFRSEVTRCEDKSASIDCLLSTLQSMCSGESADALECSSAKARSQPPERERNRAILVALMKLRAKIYQRGVYFGFLKNTSQLEPLPLELCVDHGDGDALVLRDGDVVDELDGVKSLPGGFLGFVSQVSDQCRSDTKTLFEQEGKADELPPSGVPDALEEYLSAQMDKARAFVSQQEMVFHNQLRKLSDLLLVAPGAAIVDLLDRSKRDGKRQNAAALAGIDTQWQRLGATKNKHNSELRPQLSSVNEAAALEDLCVREGERSVVAVKALREFRDSALASQSRAAVGFERELIALSSCLMRLLDTIVIGLEDVKLLSGEPLPKDKRKSLKRLRKLARVLETGDSKEVPRTDHELDGLRQLGEAPRFPKRAYPGVPSFGVGRIYEEGQSQVAREDEAWGEIRSKDDPSLPDTSNSDDGACESLLTPAHRALVRERDAVHADWVAFCTEELRATTSVARERLEDELKWRESWEQGIANIKKAHGPEVAPVHSTEPSESSEGGDQAE